MLRLTVKHFMQGNVGSLASALTYNTLLAFVPVLAIVFAVARGFGFDAMIESKLYQLLDFSPETAEQVVSFVNSYLQHTKGGIFVGVGLVVLLYTVINLTSGIETAFNTMWRVSRRRSIYRQIADYLSVFLLMPLVFIVTSGLSVFLVTFSKMYENMLIITKTVQWFMVLSPYVLTSFCFVMLYTLMPNTRVNWRYCVLPGMVAGIIFQVMAYFYMHYQIKISSYNAIYGSFAALPLFMLFIQMSWYICLFGGQVCHTCQMMGDGVDMNVQEGETSETGLKAQISAMGEQLSAMSEQMEELCRRMD